MLNGFIVAVIVVFISRIGYKTRVLKEKLFPINRIDYIVLIITIIALIAYLYIS